MVPSGRPLGGLRRFAQALAANPGLAADLQAKSDTILTRMGLAAPLHARLQAVGNLPGVSLVGASMAQSFRVYRALYLMGLMQAHHCRVNTDLATVLLVSGCEWAVNPALDIIRRLKSVLGLMASPVKEIGFAFTGQAMEEFKMYLECHRCDERITGGDMVADKTAKDRVLQAVDAVLEKTDCADQRADVHGLFETMYGVGFVVECIGIDIQPGKRPEMKLYFAPQEYLGNSVLMS